MNDVYSLSYHATLMSKDVPVGDIHGRTVTPLREELLPIYFQRGGDFAQWLSMRAIDATRTNSRLLKKVLRLQERDDVSTALHFNAVTITDTYWVRPDGSSLTWDDVRFRENYFDTLALRGDLSAFSRKPSRTPELTNIGSFEKCWRLENGKWWMYKQATPLQRFSELFVYYLSNALHFPCAKYEPAGEYIRTLDFTEGKLNFEPAFSLVGEDEDYLHSYRAFQQIGQSLADQYVELLMMDAFCLNADRHTNNYGVLRDPDSGKVLRLAPNFDNNIALISNGYLDKPRGADLLTGSLCELERGERAVSLYASRHPLPVITPELIADCCAKTGEDVDVAYVQQFVMAGYSNTPVPQLISPYHAHQNRETPVQPKITTLDISPER